MKRWSWLPLILIAVILGACGGSDDNKSDQTPQYRASANFGGYFKWMLDGRATGCADNS